MLEIELSKNILRAKELEQDVAQYYKDQVEVATTDQNKQALLGKLIQDLQWHRELSYTRWVHINGAWTITTYIFIGSLFLFIPRQG